MGQKIETSKFSHQDGREKIVRAAKKEAANMSLYSQAEDIFGTKRWEDDWRRIYQLSAPAGYIGNIVSVVLGVSGGVFLAYQLTSNWAAAVLIGCVVTLIMEAAKSVSLREGVIHGLKGKSSAVVLFSVAGLMLLASAYFSVESGKKTPYFQKWVQAESGVAVVATPTLPTFENSERLSKIDGELKAIEQERASYEARNANKTAKWLKSDTYERLKVEKETIQKDLLANSAEKQATAAAAVQASTADHLSWWYWCIVLLSELCVVFGYCFRPYYLYRCRELAIAEGKSINRHQFEVDSAPTHYEAVQVQPQMEQLTEVERLRKELEELRRKQEAPNTPKNKIGFVNTENTVNTAVNTAVNTVNTETAQTVILTDSTPDEMLLAAYRASNGSIQSRKGRDTEQAATAIAHHQQRMEKILSILEQRGSTIKMVNRAFTIVQIEA